MVEEHKPISRGDKGLLLRLAGVVIVVAALGLWLMGLGERLDAGGCAANFFDTVTHSD